MLDQFLMDICGVEAGIVALHAHLLAIGGTNFPEPEEPVVLGYWIGEKDWMARDSTGEVPVQKEKTAMYQPGRVTYGVLSHVPSCGAWLTRKARGVWTCSRDIPPGDMALLVKLGP
jgi:hypothetical protein